MDYIQILVVHSRGVYNFYGNDFGGTGVFYFFAFMHLFTNWFQILAILKPYCRK